MLAKVIFQYPDGTQKILDGESLVRWETFNAQVASFAHSHGMNPPWETIKWKEKGKILNDEQKTAKEEENKENTSKENQEA